MSLLYANACDVAAPPNGIYLVRIWDIGVNVMDDPTWTGHVDFHSEGNGVYTGASIPFAYVCLSPAPVQATGLNTAITLAPSTHARRSF